MGELLERVKLSNLSNGRGIVDTFKNNSLFFYDKYSKSDKEVTSIPVGKIQLGRFYFLHYRDDSNWMQYSPIFASDFKKFGNMIVVLGVNFNFIPLEVRVSIFDKFMSKDDFDKNRPLVVNYMGMYDELFKYGFEYSLIEYNLSQVKFVHEISMDLVPRFLYAQHPINKYDPNKLYSIWKTKIVKQSKRDEEMSKVILKDFYNATDDITENYNLLKGHIDRVQRSYEKYGKQ